LRESALIDPGLQQIISDIGACIGGAQIVILGIQVTRRQWAGHVATCSKCSRIHEPVVFAEAELWDGRQMIGDPGPQKSSRGK
jgi:hypothetical protein